MIFKEGERPGHILIKTTAGGLQLLGFLLCFIFPASGKTGIKNCDLPELNPKYGALLTVYQFMTINLQ
jgi:hypothetical protein